MNIYFKSTILSLVFVTALTGRDPFSDMFKEMQEFMEAQARFMDEQSKRMHELFEQRMNSSNDQKNQDALINVTQDNDSVYLTFSNIDAEKEVDITVTILDNKNLEGSLPLKNGSLSFRVRNGKWLIISQQKHHEEKSDKDDNKSSFVSSSHYESSSSLPAMVMDLDKSEVQLNKEEGMVTIVLPKVATRAKQLPVKVVTQPLEMKHTTA